MLEISERVESGEVSATLTLPFDLRQRSRLRVRLSGGEEAALLLPRGGVLRGGDLLRVSDGRCVRVVAASESVSTVRSSHPRTLARVAYHLGNRHVPLEVGEGYVRYLHDHVLDDMVRELGLQVEVESAPFEPEAGAYGGGQRAGHGHTHHAHPHGHSHAHSHSHSHAEPHSHAHAASHSHAPGFIRLDRAQAGEHEPVDAGGRPGPHDVG